MNDWREYSEEEADELRQVWRLRLSREEGQKGNQADDYLLDRMKERS